MLHCCRHQLLRVGILPFFGVVWGSKLLLIDVVHIREDDVPFSPQNFCATEKGVSDCRPTRENQLV